MRGNEHFNKTTGCIIAAILMQTVHPLNDICPSICGLYGGYNTRWDCLSAKGNTTLT